MSADLASILAQVARETLQRVASDPEACAAVRTILGVPQPATEPAPAGGLLTKSALAKTLGVSASTVDRLTREGLPIAAHVGDARRFDLEECRKWLAQRGKRPTRAPKRHDDVDISDVVAAAGLREVQ